MRKSKVICTSEYKAEISGQYDYEGNKNFVVGLPKKCKDIADLALSLYEYYTPTVIKGIIENKHSITLSKKEFTQL